MRRGKHTVKAVFNGQCVSAFHRLMWKLQRTPKIIWIGQLLLQHEINVALQTVLRAATDGKVPPRASGTNCISSVQFLR